MLKNETICYLGGGACYCGNRDKSKLYCDHAFRLFSVLDMKKVLCCRQDTSYLYTLYYCKNCITNCRLKKCDTCYIYVRDDYIMTKIDALNKYICRYCLLSSPFKDDMESIQDVGAIIIRYHDIKRLVQEDYQKCYLLNLYYHTIDDPWKRKLSIMEFIGSMTAKIVGNIMHGIQGDDISILHSFLDV